MLRTFAAIACLAVALYGALHVDPVHAQATNGKVTTAAPSYTDNTLGALSLDTSGNLRVSVGGSGGGSVLVTGAPSTEAAYNGTTPYTIQSTLRAIADSAISSIPAKIQGQAAAGATLPTNPVVIGGIYGTVLGGANQIVPILSDSSGNLQVNARVYGNSGAAPFGNQITSLPSVYDGANLQYLRGDANGLTISAVAPTSAAIAGILPSSSTAIASAQVIKNSAGNLYGFEITTGGTAGFFMLFNATTAPADGAVTPVKCYIVAANQTVGFSWPSAPLIFTTGIVGVFSSTGCYTKTASATAFISGDAK